MNRRRLPVSDTDWPPLPSPESPEVTLFNLPGPRRADLHVVDVNSAARLSLGAKALVTRGPAAEERAPETPTGLDDFPFEQMEPGGSRPEFSDPISHPVEPPEEIEPPAPPPFVASEAPAIALTDEADGLEAFTAEQPAQSFDIPRSLDLNLSSGELESPSLAEERGSSLEASAAADLPLDDQWHSWDLPAAAAAPPSPIAADAAEDQPRGRKNAAAMAAVAALAIVALGALLILLATADEFMARNSAAPAAPAATPDRQPVASTSRDPGPAASDAPATASVSPPIAEVPSPRDAAQGREERSSIGSGSSASLGTAGVPANPVAPTTPGATASNARSTRPDAPLPAPVREPSMRPAEAGSTAPAPRPIPPTPAVDSSPNIGAPPAAASDTPADLPAPAAATTSNTPPESTRTEATPAATERSAAAPPRPEPAAAEPASRPSAETTRELTAEEGMTAALEHLQIAYARRDAGMVKEVWPSVDARALSRAFGDLRTQKLTFDGCESRSQARSGEMACRGETTYVPRAGGPARRTESRQWKFKMTKRGADWVIDSVTFP